MKYCTKCGTEIEENIAFCPACGAPTNVVPNANANTNQPQKETTLQTIAKIFMIIGTVISAFALFPLIWCIPMTVSYCNKLKRNEPVGIGFKICTLLFVSLISGVLMLCDEGK